MDGSQHAVAVGVQLPTQRVDQKPEGIRVTTPRRRQQLRRRWPARRPAGDHPEPPPRGSPRQDASRCCADVVMASLCTAILHRPRVLLPLVDNVPAVLVQPDRLEPTSMRRFLADLGEHANYV
ncbi:hypothetical protein [Candidatus Protofrankia californiensis]|uniref:hypothetical protein n=1 Tax=Candidatus Protofrankia californiensis TaxID=1839754 RepID=UPI0013ECD3BE|nr:hypothetical protein [Candidatus Protofrankia californiensis]